MCNDCLNDWENDNRGNFSNVDHAEAMCLTCH